MHALVQLGDGSAANLSWKGASQPLSTQPAWPVELPRVQEVPPPYQCPHCSLGALGDVFPYTKPGFVASCVLREVRNFQCAGSKADLASESTKATPPCLESPSPRIRNSECLGCWSSALFPGSLRERTYKQLEREPREAEGRRAPAATDDEAAQGLAD